LQPRCKGGESIVGFAGRRRSWQVHRRLRQERIAEPTGCYGFTVLASDFDNDGYPDLYVACDSRPSLLYHNLKNGTFEEMSIAADVALSDAGREQAGMGAAVADYDEDGYMDIAKTNFRDDVPNLYHNDHDDSFDASEQL
jgi:enediyne biosynthesis protein E4